MCGEVSDVRHPPRSQLTNLIRDTVWLKSYLSAVLRVEAEAFQAANLALGAMKAALPAPTAEVAAPVAASVPNTPPDVIPANRNEVGWVGQGEDNWPWGRSLQAYQVHGQHKLAASTLQHACLAQHTTHCTLCITWRLPPAPHTMHFAG